MTRKSMNMYGSNKNNKGFTLLLAALVAAVALAIGTSVFQIAQKEVKLSSIGRDSQFAFYAADTGAECALYWDVRYRAFSPPQAEEEEEEESGGPVACDFGTDIGGGQCRGFLVSGSSFTVPDDWNSANNTVETIGGGGGGGAGGGAGARIASYAGGGGAYAKATNVSLTPGVLVTYALGAGGPGATSPAAAGGTGGDTFLCNSTSSCASISGTAVAVGAKGGTGGAYNISGMGGAAGSSVGTVKYSGGNSGLSGNGGAGGGGAAGPNGAGAVGGNSNGGSNAGGGGGGGHGGGSAGGNASGGSGGGGGSGNGNGGSGGGGGSATSGAAGGAGTEWDATHGSGGGGGGGSMNSTAQNYGGAGGLYGGGGGGGPEYANTHGFGGAGRQGLIVITYAPAVASGGGGTAPGVPFTTAVCDGQSLGTLQFTAYDVPQTFQFEPNGYCADVSVTKSFDVPTQAVRTTIRADGFSTNCASVSTSQRTLQRSVELSY